MNKKISFAASIVIILVLVLLIISAISLFFQKMRDENNFGDTVFLKNSVFPGQLGNLSMESNDGSLFLFNSSNSQIVKVFFHKPSSTVAYIKKGESFKESVAGEEREVWEESLIVILPDKSEKIVFSTGKPTSAMYYNIIAPTTISFSSNGKYISFIAAGYENSRPSIVNINSGKDIIKDNYIFNFFDQKESVFWSDDGNTLIIRNYLNDFSGEGSESIYVSEYNDPENLRKVIDVSDQKYQPEGTKITGLNYKGGEILSFFVSENGVTKTFEYNIKDQKLLEKK